LAADKSDWLEAGCKAIFLSVDTPQLGRRLNEYRNRFSPPRGISCPNVKPQGGDGAREHDGPGDAPGTRDLDPSLDWEHTIPWLRANTKLQLWIKGFCTGEDVEMAIQNGIDGIVISNHGGRQLDGVPAALDMLRECAAVAGDRIPLAVDGGIRRGTDIFKAPAMGAKHCFVGRVPIWGLAVSLHSFSNPPFCRPKLVVPVSYTH
jgi:(S)-2-hydroxy-acid oxidase